MHRTRNAAYGQPYRGFESLPLRHLVLFSHELLNFLLLGRIFCANWPLHTAEPKCETRTKRLFIAAGVDVLGMPRTHFGSLLRSELKGDRRCQPAISVENEMSH